MTSVFLQPALVWVGGLGYGLSPALKRLRVRSPSGPDLGSGGSREGSESSLLPEVDLTGAWGLPDGKESVLASSWPTRPSPKAEQAPPSPLCVGDPLSPASRAATCFCLPRV